MTRRYQAAGSGSTLALLVYFFVVCSVATAFGAGLVAFLTPTALPNPGISAYRPPTSLALYPPPRAPELNPVADNPPEPAPATAMAAAQVPKESARKHNEDASGTSRKRQRTASRRREDRNPTYNSPYQPYNSPREARNGYYQPWF
jgi:hypothetical protein